MKTRNAFALRNFDATRIFDFEKWRKLNHDELYPQEARALPAVALNHVDRLHRRIINHLMRLKKWKMAAATQISTADGETISQIQSKILRADKLKNEYETVNQLMIDMKRGIEGLLDEIDASDRRIAKNTFKEKLKMLRRGRKLTQAEMAAQLGMKRSTYGGYETGAIEPTISVLIKFAKFFQCSADWFLGL